MPLTLFAILLALFAAAGSAAQQLTVAGEECAFPFEFQGGTHDSCVATLGTSWCMTAGGVFSICAEASQEPTAPQEAAQSSAPQQQVDEQPPVQQLQPERPDPAPQAPSPAPQPSTAPQDSSESPRPSERAAPGLQSGGDSVTVVINEVLPGDPSGGPDWVELHNRGAEVVQLAGHTLSDEAGQAFTIGGPGCTAPELTVLQPGAFLTYTQGEACSFEFGLNKGSDRIHLNATDGHSLSWVGWQEGAVPEGTSISRLPDGASELALGTPTKGAANALAGPALLSAPAAGPNNGAAAEGGASINCCAALERVRGFSSSLPVMVIDTKSQDIPDEPKVDAVMCTCSEFQDYDGEVGIEIRGSTSARDFAKKSYALETRNPDGSDLQASILGMPEGEDWVLYGPEYDRSMGMRNWLALYAARRTGSYASRTQWMEVFLIGDGTPLSGRHYQGLYMLMERPGRGKDRLDMAAISDDDPSGGWLLKADNDNIDPGDRYLETRMSRLALITVYPNKDNVTPLQLDWMRRHVNEFEAVLLSRKFADPEEGYRAWIDVPAFINHFLVTEFSKNPDGYRGSTYIHKDRGGPLKMGPAWDFNEAFGTCCGYPIEGYQNGGVSGPGISGGSAVSANGWRFNICSNQARCRVDPLDGVSQWYRRIWQDTAFRVEVADTWAELRSGPLSDDAVRGEVHGVRDRIRDAVARNLRAWQGAERVAADVMEWESHVRMLEEWTMQRLAWMDAELSAVRGAV